MKNSWAVWIGLSAVIFVMDMIITGIFQDWNIFNSCQRSFEILSPDSGYNLSFTTTYPWVWDALTIPAFLLPGLFFDQLYGKIDYRKRKKKKSIKAWTLGSFVGLIFGIFGLVSYFFVLIGHDFFLVTCFLFATLGLALGATLSRDTTLAVVLKVTPWVLAIGCFSALSFGGILPGIITLGIIIGSFLCGGLMGILVFAIFIVIANVISFLYCNGDDLYKAMKRKFAKKVVRNG
ncbi:MAG: hypothetical protein EOM85_01875 [Candidatus Moranbacteria bacterium]|nr:hypothetical protein [Candidatus Moranbacteria bacterium]